VIIAALGVAVLIACSLAPGARLLSRPLEGDLKLYYTYAGRTFDGQVPYRDFFPEYPPGAFPAFLAAGAADDGYADRFRLAMLALGAATVVLLVLAMWLVGGTAAELVAGTLVFATLPLTLHVSLVFERYDLWPAVLVLVAFVALLLGRRTLGLAALGVGAAAKIYPLALLPLALLSRRGRAHVPRDLAAFAAAALVFLLPFMLVGPRGIGHVGKVLVERPLQVESLGASVLLAAHRLGAYEPTIDLSFAQSWDLAGPAADITAAASSLLGAVALVAVWYLFARGPRGLRELLLALAAAVVAVVTFGKVFSPQYLVWVGAAVPLAFGRVRTFALSATVVAFVLTTYVYQWGYPDLLEAGHTSWVMVARNAVMVAVFCSLLVELRGRSKTTVVGQASA
jgi:Glycosyltransferase family 87